jgi:hypothetical protein
VNAKTARIAVLFAACTLLLLFPVGAARIDFNPPAVTVQKSATANISLMLDEAPSGLAGYDLVIRSSNPGVAEITEVGYPSWASLSNITRNPDGSIRIVGVDLNGKVENGGTGITLATVSLRGVSAGTSSMLIEPVNIDADSGDQIAPVLSAGQVSVPGGSGTSSGGGGSSNGVVSTATSTLTTNVTLSPTVTTPEPLTTQSPTVTVPEPLTTEIPVITQETTHVATVSTPETPRPPVTAAGTTVTGEQEAIPWTLIVPGIIVVGVVLLIAFLALQRKQRKE